MHPPAAPDLRTVGLGGPVSRRVPLEEQERLEVAPTRERGRPARMHSRSVPLGFPAMGQPATLPAGTAGDRPKQSPGAVAGRAGSRSWARPCRCCAGGTPALPGGLHPLTLSHPRRSIALRVYSRSLVVRLQKQSAVSLSNDLPRRRGRGRNLPGGAYDFS